MRRLAWTFAARIGDKYQIRLTRSKWMWKFNIENMKTTATGKIYIIQNIRAILNMDFKIRVLQAY